LAAFAAHVPVICHTFHGHVFKGYFPNPISLIFIYIERLLARLSDCIVAISPSQRHDLVEVYRIAGADKIRMIPLGFHLDRFLALEHDRKLQTEFGIPEDMKLIGIVGRLAPIKNVAMALSVLKGLHEKNVKAHLCVVGDGEEKEALQKFAHDLGIENSVHWLGWVQDIERIYSSLDVLILTSKNEGTPVTIIEAFASRVPVVSTLVGGVPDLLQDEMNGFGCPDGEKENMIEKLYHLFTEDIKQQERVENAYQYAIKQHHYLSLIKSFEILTQELLARKYQKFVQF